MSQQQQQPQRMSVAAQTLVSFRQQMEGRRDELNRMLPAHIPVERFLRVADTAVQGNPDLLKCSPRSLFNAAMKAATDGLLPDGREGAIVSYRTKQGDHWVDMAQWMPMVAGIRKKVRNSGEIATWEVNIVRENDTFEYMLGDDPKLVHIPLLRGERGEIIAAYSIATLKTGEKSREVMTIEEINAIRGRSRSKDKGPWVTDFSEMCRKTVARRHSKVLPMSTDMDDLLRRDDDLYEFKAEGERAASLSASNQAPPVGIAGKFALLAGGRDDTPATPAHNPDTGEIIDHEPQNTAAAQGTARQQGSARAVTRAQDAAAGVTQQRGDGSPGAGAPPAHTAAASTNDLDEIYQQGRQAFLDGLKKRQCPHQDEDAKYEAWVNGWEAAEQGA